MKIPVYPLNIGTLAGIANFVFFVGAYMAGYYPLGGVAMLTSWISIVVVVMCVKQHRDIGKDGIIEFKDAFVIGLLSSFVYASMFAILIYIYGTLASTSLVSDHIDSTLQNETEMKELLGSARWEEMQAELHNATMGTIAFGDFLSKLTAGLIISLISAAVLKRTESDYEYE